MLAEGTTFGAYEVRRLIAAGGMGEVYLCRHRMLDRLDAVKVMRPHLAQDTNFRRRFLREALTAARLRHPNVVVVYTVDEAHGLLYLAMEYVVGDDLAAVLDRGPLAPERTVRLLRPVADALDAAHRGNLVHRDIKPRNLLVTAPGTLAEAVTLVDFGLSRLLDGDSEITRTGEVIGTAAYCSPEQLGQRPVGGACDQYSLACVAFECLTGQVPFPREGQLAIVAAHLTAPPPRASAVRPGLPAAVDLVFARALAKDPAQRYPTCTAFVEALGSALGQTPAGDPYTSSRASKGPLHAPGELAEAVRAGVRPPAGPLAVRVGLDVSGAPIVLRLDRAPLVVRATPAAAAGLLRWLLVQAVSRHDPRSLCLACALAPVPEENWLWLNWLPHARPSTPPVPGPHVATTPGAGADLLARVRGVPAGPAATVLVVLDAALNVRPDGLPAGVRLIHLAPPGSAVPAGSSTVDLAGATCRVSPAGGPPIDGVPESVDAAYARGLVDHLPEA